jgi:uroporphyrinogen decarboxylase
MPYDRINLRIKQEAITMTSKMTSRQRVLKALNFEPVDRVPRDLGGMASTGISSFAYPKLVQALGLAPRRPRCHDTNQMLALPEMDVLDALGCDVVSVFWGVTNAFVEPQKWHNYDFNGRLPAMVREPKQFETKPDGTIVQPQWNISMAPTAVVFNQEHAGQPFDLSAELPKPDLTQVKKEQEETLPKDKDIREMVELCKRVRNTTDKAVFFNGPTYTGIAITSPGGCAVWPMVCLTEPQFVADYHGLMTEYAIKRIDLLLKEVAPYVDIAMMASDDWGTQNALFAPPRIFEELFLPYLKQINGHTKKVAPNVKRFLHSCGAIYDILDLVIASGFDVLNPIQWPAGGHSYKAWKDKCRNRIAMWGGGVNTQHTLPLGTLADIETEVRQVVACLSENSGFIFNGIHNLLAETPPEKIIAMYHATAQCKV